MRETADPPADSTIRTVFESGDTAAVQGVLNTLRHDDDIVPENLPGPVRDYLEALPEIPEPDRALIIDGQKLFSDHGPEILAILACYSLPAAYAARKGVQVLYRTGYLQNRANIRLFQTSQMVIDVMTPGGLGPKGRGRITAQKVRLMHAAIRHLLLSDTKNPWSPEFGVPINQEDLAGTLMTFTHVIHDGLNKLGVAVGTWPPGYLNAWQVVARLLGILPELIPSTPDDATELSAIIDRRQIAPSPEGRALTESLLQMLGHYSPPGFKRMPAALMRHFLPEELINLGARVERFIERIKPDNSSRLVFRSFGTHMVEILIKAELGEHQPQFRIPTDLHDVWQLSKT
jgi:hypothetical protein